jgi:hypothetical protein
MTAATAKSIANLAMARQWAERDRMTLRLPPAFSDVGPGDMVEISDVAGLWLVAAATIDSGVVVIEVKRLGAGGQPSEADGGRPVTEADEPIGATDIALFDLPDLGFAARDSVTMWAAASADGAFRTVPASVTCNGQPLAPISLARRAVLGRCATVLGAGATNIFDMVRAVDVTLTDTSQVLLNADDDALAMGANLALVGGELIQFGRAEALGDGRFRLSRLLRGRRGTEWAVGAHAADERFLLVDRAVLAPIALAAGMRGASVAVAAHGIADDPLNPPAATCVAGGEAQRPLAPCSLVASISLAGDVAAGWVERSRDAFGWIDSSGGVAEAGRRFRVTIGDGVTSVAVETADVGAVFEAADLAPLGPTLTVAVETLGALGVSRAVMLQFDR